MKCGAVEHWLLTERSDTPLPMAVRTHLAECTACLLRRQALLDLERLTKRLPLPPSPPQIKARLWERLDRSDPVITPAPAAAPHRRRRARPRHTRLVAIATVACLLIGVGLMIGRLSKRPQTPEPEPSKAPEVVRVVPIPKKAVKPLVVRLADQNSQLAAASNATQRLDVFTRMAEEIETDALAKARSGPVDEISRLVQLHQMVVYSGIAARTSELPDSDKAVILNQLTRSLTSSAARIERENTTLLPAVADMLKPMAATCRTLASDLVNGKTTLPAVSPIFDDAALAQLVKNSLRLANEKDPLKRAEVSAETAGLLSQTIILFSASGDTESVDGLGTHLSTLMESGVGDNLDRAASDDWTGDRKGEMDLVRQRVDLARQVLEKNLAQAPPESAMGLQRVLEVSKPGWDRAFKGGKGKGKGPPMFKQDFMPKGRDKN